MPVPFALTGYYCHLQNAGTVKIFNKTKVLIITIQIKSVNIFVHATGLVDKIREERPG